MLNPKDHLRLFKKTREDGTYRIVGGLNKSFHEEGIKLLELDGRILGVYISDKKDILLNAGLLKYEAKAAHYLGEATKKLYGKYQITPREIKLCAASMVISLEEILRYKDVGHKEIINDLSKRYKIPEKLAEYRVETLKYEDPDRFLKLALIEEITVEETPEEDEEIKTIPLFGQEEVFIAQSDSSLDEIKLE